MELLTDFWPLSYSEFLKQLCKLYKEAVKQVKPKSKLITLNKAIPAKRAMNSLIECQPISSANCVPLHIATVTRLRYGKIFYYPSYKAYRKYTLPAAINFYSALTNEVATEMNDTIRTTARGSILRGE